MIIGRNDGRYRALEALGTSNVFWKDRKCPAHKLYLGSNTQRAAIKERLVYGGYITWDEGPDEYGTYTLTDLGINLIARWPDMSEEQIEQELRKFTMNILQEEVREKRAEIKKLKAQIRRHESAKK